MANTDKFNKVLSGTTRPVATTLSAQKLSGATSATVVSTTGWDNTTAVHGIMYRTDASGANVAGSQIDWKADVSGTTLSNFIVTAGTDDTYAIGTTVELSPTAAWGDDMATGVAAEHKQADGAHMFATVYDPSNQTLETLKLVGQASAVNEITITNATTGAFPTISATGEADTGIDFENSEGEEILKLDAIPSAVNELTVSNAATGNKPIIAATGGDTNIGVSINGKGTGAVDINGARPWLFLGSAEVAADQTGITTIADMTNASVAVTVPAGATTVRITGFVRSGNGTVDTVNSVYIFEGGTQLSVDQFLSRTGGASGTHKPIYIGTATVGAHTYKLRVEAGSGTMATRASATAPAYIIVECC